MPNDYVDLETITLKGHAKYNELWVQSVIADNPSIVGLGELELRDRERTQPRAGRLDLLFRDLNSKRRYEVELQLGPVDESHIIRTIEYWDIERRRYPQYEHVAVLMAEDVTSRFLNVISLLNGTIPLILIQMQALAVGDDKVTIVFTKVLDEFSRGLVDEDEEMATETDRDYWEHKATKGTVALADDVLKAVSELEEDLASIRLKYTKYYIGLEKDGAPCNFVLFRPTKTRLNLELRLAKTDDIDAEIERAGLDSLDYDDKSGRYRVRLTKQDVKSRIDILADMSKRAYGERQGL